MASTTATKSRPKFVNDCFDYTLYLNDMYTENDHSDYAWKGKKPINHKEQLPVMYNYFIICSLYMHRVNYKKIRGKLLRTLCRQL